MCCFIQQKVTQSPRRVFFTQMQKSAIYFINRTMIHTIYIWLIPYTVNVWQTPSKPFCLSGPSWYYITGWGDFCFGKTRNWKNYFGCTNVFKACRDHKIPCSKFSQLRQLQPFYNELPNTWLFWQTKNKTCCKFRGFEENEKITENEIKVYFFHTCLRRGKRYMLSTDKEVKYSAYESNFACQHLKTKPSKEAM